MPKVFILRNKQRELHQQIWRFCLWHPCFANLLGVCSEHLFAMALLTRVTREQQCFTISV